VLIQIQLGGDTLDAHSGGKSTGKGAGASGLSEKLPILLLVRTFVCSTTSQKPQAATIGAS